jgi:hypothetical protein
MPPAHSNFDTIMNPLVRLGLSLYRKTRGKMRQAELTVRRVARLNESETKLITESQRYWNDPSNRGVQQNSHWRGVGIFADDAGWLALGREHLRIYEEFSRIIGVKQPPKRVVEWGCGGGMNAVHFGRGVDAYYGVDISSASL